MCEFNTKITIAQLLRLSIASAKPKIYSPRRGYLSPGNSVVLEIAAALLFISVTIFLLILGLILLKLKLASNTPVIFVILHALLTVLEISQKPFAAKNVLKQTIYLLLEAKNSSYFNCVRANKTKNPCHKVYAIKYISDSSGRPPFLKNLFRE